MNLNTDVLWSNQTCSNIGRRCPCRISSFVARGWRKHLFKNLLSAQLCSYRWSSCCEVDPSYHIVHIIVIGKDLCYSSADLDADEWSKDGRKRGQEDGWSPLSPAGRKARERRACWVIRSLALASPGFHPSSSVCTLNPLITKSILVQCGCLQQNCQTPGWSLWLFWVLPFSKHLQRSTRGVGGWILSGLFRFVDNCTSFEGWKNPVEKICFIFEWSLIRNNSVTRLV